MTISLSHQKSLPPLKKILVVGNGGRENSLAWALSRCSGIEQVWVTPGNGGTNDHLDCIRLGIEATEIQALLETCQSNQVDLVVIGPEAPLAAGLADELRAAGQTVFGPNANGAQLEASKSWAKNLLQEAGIPTAKYWDVSNEKEALEVVEELQQPLVVKADGLASGKGVAVPDTIDATKKAIQEAFKGKFGAAGTQLVLEERLNGPEISVFALCDGKQLVLLPPAQDHKRLKEGDQGPNTGGMGAYAPAPLLSREELNEVKRLILEPTVTALQKKGIEYRGVIYAGLMLTNSGPKVIEFNCRFGDPECQTLMPLLGPELAQVLQACAHGCLELAPELSIHSGCSACVVAAASGYPEAPRYGDLVSVELQTGQSIQLFQAGTKRDQNGSLFTAGGRVLSIVAQGKNFDEAFTNAYQGLEKVHFDGITYRRDIGNQVRQS